MVNRFYIVMLTIASALVSAAMPRIWAQGLPGRSQEPLAARVARQAAVEIDKQFEAVWREAGVEPLAPAESLAVARRLSLALCGTVPSLEEIRWIERQPAETAIDAYLERLLSDRRFADYMAERLARAYVGTSDGPFLVYRRRRFVYWLSDQLDGNRPYDDLVHEIISAEGLWTDKPATNFITARVIENEGPDPLALAARTTRSFLGVRIDCAQCHDHPFADWKQRDFEGLAAFFAQAKQTFRGIEEQPGDLEIEDAKTKEKRHVEPQIPFAEELLPNSGGRRQQLASWITEAKVKQGPDGESHDYFAEAIANRVWTLLFGQGICEPVDDLESDRRVPGVLEKLGEDFRANGADLRRLIRVIASTRAFRISSGTGSDVSDDQERLYAAFPMTRLRSEQIAGSLVQASSLQTVDADSHILVRATRFFNTIDFIKNYGDAGEEELNAHMGTIPQRLVMMNGKMPRERVQASPFNSAGRIARLSPSDESRVRTTYLVALTRLPTTEEESHFVSGLRELNSQNKHLGVEDLLWVLFNSTEFSWNH